MPVVPWRQPVVREGLLSAAAAATVAAALVWLGPPGSDLASHAYQRTMFLEHGPALWNNFWYAGQYSFITYSLLYYPLAAALGIGPLAVVSIAAATLAFTVVVRREWGRTARWSSRAFAVVWAGIVLSAAYPFALGAALALLGLWALQAGRRGRFALLSALTLAASPVAFLLLAVVLGAVALDRLASLPQHLSSVAAVGFVGLVEVVLWRLFPAGGAYPFSPEEAAAGAVFCLLGLLFSWRLENARALRYLFAVYLAALLLAYLVPSAVGENVTRLRYAAIPVAVLVVSLRRWKPLLPGLAAIALAISWNVTPLVRSFANGRSDATVHASTWAPAIAYLRANLHTGYRVEAVDTVGHWPSLYLARADIPLARGWFRQADFPQNRVLYEPLRRAAYLRWLRGLGVAYVVLARAPPDYSARAEARLVRSGRAGLVPVLATGRLTIYEVPRPSPIVTGPGDPQLVALTHDRLRLVLDRSGRYRIAVRYSPYWHAAGACLGAGDDGMLRLWTREPGAIQVVFRLEARHVLDELTGRRRSCTPPRAAGGS